MDFEKYVMNELKRKATNIEPSPNLEDKVQASFYKYRKMKNKEKTSMKKKLLLGFVAAAILIPTGTFAGTTLMDKIVGTPEKARQDIGMTEDGYNLVMERIEIAKSIFTEEDFEKYVALLQETYHFYKKVSVVENGERQYTATNRLNVNEEKRDREVMEQLNTYEERIDEHFTYTFEQAEKITGFPIKHPTYIPVGHQLVFEEVKAEATLDKPMPLISMRYEKRNVKKEPHTSDVELGFTIHQLEIVEGEYKDYFLDRPFDKPSKRGHNFTGDIKKYTLNGYDVTFGEYKESNVRAMKIVVPAKEGENAYQIYINGSMLSKKELEKVLLSIVE
ncbi:MULTISPECIES: hypothetical protein [Bacillus cereus group]|uniref:DUF4367 domain-containing protein n=1 Tax=Bacillus thuringiensis TaxID=1428 RepID=A0A1C4EPX1_BACTU|nr:MULTISPECIES: hypothetical protein [Bacillus cereus group]MCU5683325.1 hypothetical protein [Bacillus wiedmannii]MED3024104.1 hypothetical protein [Bacillus wiedmannii]OTX98838.1 hypothetical protein BK729_12835 [Bacillus thuringiensis serovar wratislaviensis]OUB58274.1 hypothetical protein BK743_15305 [Bacillus thuringiensis serovar sylvestriensis]SCC45654.1 Uncharacterized protein BTT61001_03382 [Bacillus thuringiensis]